MVRSKGAQEQTSRQPPPFNRSPPCARLGLFLVGRGGGKRSAFDDGWCVRLGEWQTRFLHTVSVAELERLEHWVDGHLRYEGRYLTDANVSRRSPSRMLEA